MREGRYPNGYFQDREQIDPYALWRGTIGVAFDRLDRIAGNDSRVLSVSKDGEVFFQSLVDHSRLAVREVGANGSTFTRGIDVLKPQCGGTLSVAFWQGTSALYERLDDTFGYFVHRTRQRDGSFFLAGYPIPYEKFMRDCAFWQQKAVELLQCERLVGGHSFVFPPSGFAPIDSYTVSTQLNPVSR